MIIPGHTAEQSQFCASSWAMSSRWCNTMSVRWCSNVVLTGKMLADAVRIVTTGYAGINTTTFSDSGCMTARGCKHYRQSLTVTVAAFGPWQFCTPPVPPLVMTASSLHTNQASNHFPSFFHAYSFNHARCHSITPSHLFFTHVVLNPAYTAQGCPLRIPTANAKK